MKGNVKMTSNESMLQASTPPFITRRGFYSDGSVLTLACVYTEGEGIKYGWALKSPKDILNRKLGRKIASNRLFSKGVYTVPQGSVAFTEKGNPDYLVTFEDYVITNPPENHPRLFAELLDRLATIQRNEILNYLKNVVIDNHG